LPGLSRLDALLVERALRLVRHHDHHHVGLGRRLIDRDDLEPVGLSHLPGLAALVKAHPHVTAAVPQV